MHQVWRELFQRLLDDSLRALAETDTRDCSVRTDVKRPPDDLYTWWIEARMLARREDQDLMPTPAQTLGQLPDVRLHTTRRIPAVRRDLGNLHEIDVLPNVIAAPATNVNERRYSTYEGEKYAAQAQQCTIRFVPTGSAR